MPRFFLHAVYGEGEACPQEDGPGFVVEAESEEAARALWWERSGAEMTCLDWLECRPVEAVAEWRVAEAEPLG
jgi:hypothetical protein